MGERERRVEKNRSGSSRREEAVVRHCVHAGFPSTAPRPHRAHHWLPGEGVAPLSSTRLDHACTLTPPRKGHRGGPSSCGLHRQTCRGVTKCARPAVCTKVSRLGPSCWVTDRTEQLRR